MNIKSLILWADDDWTNYSDIELKQQLVIGDLGIFHYFKNTCYEGKPRKVCITIEEIT